MITLNEEEMKEYYSDISITESTNDSDCYIITKDDKNNDCIIIYDKNIPSIKCHRKLHISFSGGT